MRMYKTGSKWALWRWSWAPDKFLVRLHLVMTPWFAICLHWINHADKEPYLHDHPVSFFSVILRGGYSEARYIGGRADGYIDQHWWPSFIRERKWFNWFKATPHDRHAIVSVAPHTLTLAFMGPKVRDWGYHTREGWLYWRDYQKQQKEGVRDEEGNLRIAAQAG